MHELAIAMSLVEGACEEAAKHAGRRVEAVHIRLGRLSGVVKDALLFSYDLAARDTPLEGSRLAIEEIEAAVYCRDCDEECELSSIQNFACTVCGTLSPQVVRGRELMIVGLELKDEYAAATG